MADKTTYSRWICCNETIIDITGTDDITNGKLSSWDSLAKLQLQFVRQYANQLVMTKLIFIL